MIKNTHISEVPINKTSTSEEQRSLLNKIMRMSLSSPQLLFHPITKSSFQLSCQSTRQSLWPQQTYQRLHCKRDSNKIALLPKNNNKMKKRKKKYENGEKNIQKQHLIFSQNNGTSMMIKSYDYGTSKEAASKVKFLDKYSSKVQQINTQRSHQKQFHCADKHQVDNLNGNKSGLQKMFKKFNNQINNIHHDQDKNTNQSVIKQKRKIKTKDRKKNFKQDRFRQMIVGHSVQSKMKGFNIDQPSLYSLSNKIHIKNKVNKIKHQDDQHITSLIKNQKKLIQPTYSKQNKPKLISIKSKQLLTERYTVNNLNKGNSLVRTTFTTQNDNYKSQLSNNTNENMCLNILSSNVGDLNAYQLQYSEFSCQMKQKIIQNIQKINHRRSTIKIQRFYSSKSNIKPERQKS